MNTAPKVQSSNQRAIRSVTPNLTWPAFDGESYQGMRWSIRKTHADLSQILAQYQQQQDKARVVEIYADTLVIPDNTTWIANQTALLIFAENIQSTGSSQIYLDYRQGEVSKLMVYAGNIQGDLNAICVFPEGQSPTHELITLNNQQSLGFVIEKSGQSAALTALTALQPDMIQADSNFHALTTQVYFEACACFDSKPTEAAERLHWLCTIGRVSNEYTGLYNQCFGLLSLLQSSGSQSKPVPLLTQSVYKESLDSGINAAKAYASQYTRLLDRNLVLDDRKQAAQLMLDNYKNAETFSDQLIAQCQKNIDRWLSAIDKTEWSIKYQEQKIAEARITFEHGLKAWEQDQKLEAAFNMIGAIINFAAAIGSMVATAGASSGAAAGQVAGAVSQAAKASAELAKTLKTLADVLKQLNDTYKAVSQIASTAKSITSFNKALKKLKDIQIPSGTPEDPAGIYFWRKFRLEADAALKLAIDKGIPGATQYQLQLDILSELGQSQAANQAALIDKVQEMARLVAQKQQTLSDEANVKQYINQISAQEDINITLQQPLFWRFLNLKQWLFLALRQYEAAYQYWALKPSMVTASLTSEIPQYESDLYSIARDYEQALSQFVPYQPQPFSNKVLTINDPESLNAIKQTNTLTLNIPLDSSLFQGFGRVRLDIVQVFLEGLSGSQPIYINMASSGQYADRYKGERFLFSGQAIERVFQYQNQNGQVNILVDGRVADETKFAYFQPTPFTAWTLTLPKAQNAQLDLSTLTAVKIELSGILIPDTTQLL